MADTVIKYKRVLLKISGEALMGDLQFGYDPSVVHRICSDVAEVHNLGVQICLVIGGGNIFRGASAKEIGVERVNADYMGMMATVMNALALQSSFKSMGIEAKIQSAISVSNICESYTHRKALNYVEKGNIVIFAGGTGNPFFTTDTAAALRASEMNCDAIFKGTQVDGVYNDDPKKNKEAVRFDNITYKKVLQDDLAVMDAASISLARENNIPVIVFSLREKGEFLNIINGKGTYTLIG